MPKVDRIKTEVGFHEKMFFGALVAILTLSGWIATHYQTTDIFVLVLAMLAFFGICVFGIDQYKRIKRLLVDLEEC